MDAEVTVTQPQVNHDLELRSLCSSGENATVKLRSARRCGPLRFERQGQ